MNDSYRNNNEVEYCFKAKHKFKKNSRFPQSQDTTLDSHCIIIIYLECT